MINYKDPHIKSMTLLDFTSEVEAILEEQVKRLLPGYWDEDQLTNNFLIALTTQLSYSIIADLRGVSQVFINAFKQRGNLTETKYGDIAVILDITFPDGEKLNGVGYLEAKKRTKGSVTFDAVKKSQLKKINAHAPRARLLLYDYEPVTGFVPTHFEEEIYFRRHHRSLRLMPTTHSVAVPLNLALQANRYDTKLYKFGIPFSHQLCFRYMYGQDLEFEQTAIEASRGFAVRQNLSKYILAITIGPEDKINGPDDIVNTNIYESIS